MAELVSVKSRLESAGKAWLAATFATASEFTVSDGTFSFYAGRRSGEFQLPCVVVNCEEAEEVEAPGAGIYKALLKFVLMTSIDEVSPSANNAETTHNARVDLLVNYIQDIETLKQNLATRGPLRVYGLVPRGQVNDIVNRYFVEAIDIEVFCQTI